MKSEINLSECHEILFPFTNRILNSIEDSRDIAQDVLTEYISSNRINLEDPKNYLIRSAINKSINLKKKKERIRYKMSPEVNEIDPIKTDFNLTLENMITLSFQILINKLNVKERAVFILKEGFYYSHEEISEALDITTANSRKILSRSKQKLKGVQLTDKYYKDTKTLDCLSSFINAIKNRDLIKLKSLLQLNN